MLYLCGAPDAAILALILLEVDEDDEPLRLLPELAESGVTQAEAETGAAAPHREEEEGSSIVLLLAQPRRPRL